MAKANAFSPIFISAVKVLARLAAKRAVQQQLRDQGVRVTTYPYAELMRQAHEYLSNHPELYVAALERAKRMTADGVFGERHSMASTVQISGS
jgi:hypothetical protein